MASITYITPTIGRLWLSRTIAYTLADGGFKPGDEIIILGDVHDGPLPLAEAICGIWPDVVRYFPLNAGHHCNGHCQLNWILHSGEIKTDYISWLDDDDVYAPGALDMLHKDIDDYFGKILIYQYRVPDDRIVPPTGMRELHGTLVSGQSIVLPNREDWFGEWTDNYMGDWDFIESTRDKVGMHHFQFFDKVLVVGRPLDHQTIERFRHGG